MTETIGITFDFNEWAQKYTESNFSPYLEQLQNYVTGFLLVPCGLYENQPVLAKVKRTEGDNFNDIIVFLKELQKQNKKVFLYEIDYNCMIDNNKFYEFRYGELDGQKIN